MSKLGKTTWHLVKNISKKRYFWPLIAFLIIGIILDTHSTYLWVVAEGIAGEKSPGIAFLFHKFAASGLGIGASILLAMILTKIILLVLVPLALLSTTLATRGNAFLFRLSFFTLCALISLSFWAACWNYYHYFFAIMR